MIKLLISFGQKNILMKQILIQNFIWRPLHISQKLLHIGHEKSIPYLF